MDKLAEMTEQEIIKILESDQCSAKDFVVLSKALFAKRGMSYYEWQEIFHEQELKEGLRQYGLPEDLVLDVVACTIHAMLGDNPNIEHLLPFDKNRRPTCTVCHAAPYKAVKIEAKPTNGNKEEPIVIIALVCKHHFQRIQRQDVRVHDAIRRIAIQQQKKME